jgi:hypothetical protein
LIHCKSEIGHALEGLKNLPSELGSIESLRADAGYFSEANVKYCEEQRITSYISAHRDKHNRKLKDLFNESPPLPPDADVAGTVKHCLKTDEGKALYARRKCMVESVFASLKQ